MLNEHNLCRKIDDTCRSVVWKKNGIRCCSNQNNWWSKIITAWLYSTQKKSTRTIPTKKVPGVFVLTKLVEDIMQIERLTNEKWILSTANISAKICFELLSIMRSNPMVFWDVECTLRSAHVQFFFMFAVLSASSLGSHLSHMTLYVTSHITDNPAPLDGEINILVSYFLQIWWC